jgi:hypothetical protein
MNSASVPSSVPTATPTGTAPNVSRADLEMLYQAQSELERRRRAAPLLFYRDMMMKHAKQRAFHEAGKKFRRRLFLGANRSGKSFASIHEVIGHVVGYRFWEIPNLRLTKEGELPPREEVPPAYWIRRTDGIPMRVPNVGMFLTGLPRDRGIAQNLFPALMAALPEATRQKCKVIKGGGGTPVYMDFPNGSRLMWASAEQEDLSFEGFILDYCAVDEPIRASLYSAIWARLTDNFGDIWFTLTPLGAHSAWMYTAFYTNPPPDMFVVEVEQKDNPGLTAEQRQAFEDNGEYSERERAARLHGRFQFLGDRVYDLFDPSVHIIPSFQPPREWIHGLSVDPHLKRPAFLAWFAFDPTTHTYHFYREWPPGVFHKMRSGGLPHAELATVIRNAEGRCPAPVRVVDPRFGKAEAQRYGFRETSWVNAMAEYGLFFDATVPNTATIDYGHEVINDLLRYDKNFPVGPANRPHLYIHDNCPNIAESFMSYAFSNVESPERGLFTKVMEEYKDAADAVRYAVLYPLPCTTEERNRLQRFTDDDLRRENDG